MRFLPVVLFIFCLLPEATGQDSEQGSIGSDELYLRIKSLNFFRNNEYASRVTGSGLHITGELPEYTDKSLWLEGSTLPGFFFRPEIVYQPSEKISFRTGAHFLKYWGANGFKEIRPVFSGSLKIAKGTVLTLGSLSGSPEHLMFDPHFNTERNYTNYAEDGVQVRTENDRIFNDAWISWENYVFRGDNEREVFTFGESFIYTTPQVFSSLTFKIPVQIQMKHFGGQISNYPEHVVTFVNFASGARADYKIGDNTGVLGLEYTAFLNRVIPARDEYDITSGNASWMKLHYDIRRFNVTASWWHADDFFAPDGNGLYASVYDFDSGFVIHKRELITAAVSIRVLPEDYIELYFGIEGFYDVCTNRLDHAITLHLDFDRLFRIK
jgi:hypothetical protein